MSNSKMAVGYNRDSDHSPEIEERRISEAEITADEPTVTSLNLDDTDKNFATWPLTGGNGVVVRSYTTSPHYLPLAILTVFINPFFGLPAVVCACMSRNHRRRGDDHKATNLGKASFWVSAIGMAVGVVVVIFVIVYVYVMIPNIIRVDLWSKLNT